jgi:hypothetical protein
MFRLELEFDGDIPDYHEFQEYINAILIGPLTGSCSERLRIFSHP